MHEIGCDICVEHLPERAFDVKANVLDSKNYKSTRTGSQSSNLTRDCAVLVITTDNRRMNKDFLHPRYDGKSAPVISVVLPVYNGEEHLSEAIDSILTRKPSRISNSSLLMMVQLTALLRC